MCFDVAVPIGDRSIKEQIICAAERLFAAHGFDGVSMREVGAEAGSGNNSAVQYHFGSKEQLVAAIFQYRLPFLEERREALIAERQPDNLRSWVECYVLPILEQAEVEGSHYLSFVAMLQQHSRRDLFEAIPDEYWKRTRVCFEQVKVFLDQIAEPLRTHRIHQAIIFSVHSAGDRERAKANGYFVLPFALHVTDLLDGVVGFLQAPVSSAAMAALRGTDPTRLYPPLLV